MPLSSASSEILLTSSTFQDYVFNIPMDPNWKKPVTLESAAETVSYNTSWRFASIQVSAMALGVVAHLRMTYPFLITKSVLIFLIVYSLNSSSHEKSDILHRYQVVSELRSQVVAVRIQLYRVFCNYDLSIIMVLHKNSVA